MTEERVVTRQRVTTPTTTTTSVDGTDSVATDAARQSAVVDEVVRHDEIVRRSPSGGEVARRVTVFLFGIVQALIGLRIVLLLINANQGNGIVRFIYDVSGVFVAPFEGVLRVNAVASGASILDISAVVAIVGWTILEILVIAFIGIQRREP
ncbi:MAG: YggT family protein [Chloroflexota bacterium]